MRSLLAPLVIGLVLSLAAIFAVQWKVVRVTIDEVMEDYVADELVQDAEELFSSLNPLERGAAVLALQHFDPVFLSPSSGRYYQILVDGAVVLRSASLVEQSLPVRTVEPGQRLVDRTSGPHGQELLLSASGYERDGLRITIAVAADMKPVRTEFDRLSLRYTQVSMLMFVLLVCLQVGIVRLALAPLRKVRADVGRLERGDIVQLGERVPAEVLPLVREVNRLLALLSQRLQRSRESLGNLAHALKAPLTVLTHMAGDEHVRRDPLLAGQMAEQLALLRSRIESELRRARVAGGRAPGATLDLGVEIESLASTLRKMYRDRELDIECRIAPGIQFVGDREDLLELSGNLLDNACKWARSKVRVSVSDGDGLELTVEDDGPGCPPDELSRIAGRGVRIDESTAGHGLGLAIAKGIAVSYGAELRLGRSAALGGFEAEVVFPAN
ncbi:MAG TPA: sensor histidine kinase [Burkholderiaceae bacterium]|mgnify:CR=1 FL=1|jgi:signal transduction histidine kinase|nr:sensor histidine kinase [Burkholderiaceae bacterium]